MALFPKKAMEGFRPSGRKKKSSRDKKNLYTTLFLVYLIMIDFALGLPYPITAKIARAVLSKVSVRIVYVLHKQKTFN